MLPKPLKCGLSGTVNKLDYQQRVLEGPLMKDVKSLIDFGSTVFEKLDYLVDLTDIDSIKAEAPKMKLPPGAIPLNQEAASFYSSFKFQNGMSSLRRGYYKLLPSPELVPVLDYMVWRMDVLFCEGPFNDTIYKYKCNVGPLVNKFAVCRDLTSKRFVPVVIDDKKQSLIDLTQRVIYVSNAELIQVDDWIKPYEAKEVLWFVW